MRPRSRPGYGLFQLLFLLALIALVLGGVMIPALVKAQLDAERLRKAMNLQHILTGMQNYTSTHADKLPPGVDDKHFSALFHLLPYIEQESLYKATDRRKDSADKANAKVRSTRVKTFVSPFDPLDEKSLPGGTNYFAMAGSKMPLKDNDGVLSPACGYLISNIPDGTANTIAFVEMLRGDGGKKAESVQRQHVRLKANDLKTLEETDGVKDFENDKNIVSDRGSAWIDGRFLQATTNGTRGMLDPKPDVDCGGEGGLAGIRAVEKGTHAGMCDGSVHWISPKVSFETWQKVCIPDDGVPVGSDW